MSNWSWKVFLVIVIAKTCYVCYLMADDTVQKLPFCNPENSKDGPVHSDLMIASTLDGKLTAFSTQTGIKLWDVETQPLFSSNLHHVELTSAGKWVRLVPSLRGALYWLSGETIEQLPFDAEQLLSSSYKYSDDLVMAGAKESVWYGVDAATGGVVYECSSGGCSRERAAGAGGGGLLVLRRLASTVRALDPRHGNEKWNFSVAEHHLALKAGSCSGAEPGAAAEPYRVSAELHAGRLALRDPARAHLLWQQQLEAPLAALWRLAGGALQPVDVLRAAAGGAAGGGAGAAGGGGAAPTLYIGVHDRQLYIQESPAHSPAALASPQPWRPVAAPPLLAAHAAPPPLADTALQRPAEPDDTLSKVALYGPTALSNDAGLFLYLQETCDQSVQVSPDAIDTDTIDNEEQEHHHIHVHVYSLWFWWKEVLLIAVSSALLMNLMIWPRFFAPKVPPPPPLPINQEYIVVERHYSQPAPPAEYVCRYESDFTPLRCLGKGGFGVVFEARNNIDHCSYAVKRITLPRKEKKRERVLREVRALAKLEHAHIVRYFNAWVEQPPPLWQSRTDARWMSELDDASLVTSDEYTATSPAPPRNKHDNDVMLNLQLDDCVDALHFDNLPEPSRRHRSLSCSDSFIVFDEEAGKDVTSSKDLSTRSVHSGDVTSLSKNAPTDDDSYVVFAHSQEHDLSKHQSGHHVTGHHSTSQNASNNNSHAMNSGYPEARNNSVDKRLEKIKECDYKTDSSSKNKKKKGHTRHWSLDMVVKSSSTQADASSAQMYLYIQMQLCRRDSLHDWLRNNRTIESRGATARTLFSQIVSAVEYVHLAGLIHRDLKPSNILFALDGRVKVGDFGLVTAMGDTSSDGERPDDGDTDHRHTYRVGTHLYMSPEQLAGRAYSYKVDVYSLGLILFELLQPFGTEAERVACLLRLRRDRLPQRFAHLYPSETSVLKMMLSKDPALRPTASGVRARAPLYEATDERYHFNLPAMAAA